jgi:hypothetical protein
VRFTASREAYSTRETVGFIGSADNLQKGVRDAEKDEDDHDLAQPFWQ